jgi:hypothetical protein
MLCSSNRIQRRPADLLDGLDGGRHSNRLAKPALLFQPGKPLGPNKRLDPKGAVEAIP